MDPEIENRKADLWNELVGWLEEKLHGNLISRILRTYGLQEGLGTFYLL